LSCSCEQRFFVEFDGGGGTPCGVEYIVFNEVAGASKADRTKRLVADLSLDKEMLKAVIAKNGWSS
jgi:hypothetical protein